MTDDLDPETNKHLEAFIGGYFAGFREGICAAASLLKRVEIDNAPIPNAARHHIIAMGIAIEKNIDTMVDTAMKEVDDSTKEQ